MALTKMMRTAAGDRIEEMETNIRTKFNSATKEDKFFGHWLAETLKEFALGSNLEESIAKKLEALAHELEGEGDFYAGRGLLQACRGMVRCRWPRFQTNRYDRRRS